LAIDQVPWEPAIELQELVLEERAWAIDPQTPELVGLTASGAGISHAAAGRTGTPSVAGQRVTAGRTHALPAAVAR